MLLKSLRPFTVIKPGRRTALLLAVLSLLAGLQAKNNDVSLPVPTASAGKTLTLKETSSTVAPAITLQPVSQTVPAGDSVTFTAAASGTPVPTYQWLRNGEAISDATGSTFTISRVGLGDAGNYSVFIANTAGVVTSDLAELKTFVAAPNNAFVSISIK